MKEDTSTRKNASKVKIFFVSLLVYMVFNILFNISHDVIGLVLNKIIGGTFLVEKFYDFPYFVGFFVGIVVSEKMLEKFFCDNDEDIRRCKFTCGILFLINYSIFIIDHFVYGEYKLYRLTIMFLFGLFLTIHYRKRKE